MLSNRLLHMMHSSSPIVDWSLFVLLSLPDNHAAEGDLLARGGQRGCLDKNNNQVGDNRRVIGGAKVK